MTWMQFNKLKLNADETECIWATTRQRRSTFTAPNLTVEGSVMAHVTSVSFLTVIGIYNNTYLIFAERAIFNCDSYDLYVVHYRRIIWRRCYTRSSRVDWTIVIPCLLDYLHVTSQDYNLFKMPQHLFLVAYQSLRAFSRCSAMYFTGYQSANVSLSRSRFWRKKLFMDWHHPICPICMFQRQAIQPYVEIGVLIAATWLWLL